MKYRVGSMTFEAIGTFVRVSVANIGGPDAPVKVAVTKRQCPSNIQVVELLSALRGHDYHDNATLQACSRAAADARNNKAD